MSPKFISCLCFWGCKNIYEFLSVNYQSGADKLFGGLFTKKRKYVTMK